jgi:signal transduction histidine kinase
MIGDGRPDLLVLVEEYQRAFNERDLHAWAALLDPEIEIEIDLLTLRGIKAALGFARQIDQTFPGMRSETVRVLASSGDTVVCETRPVNPTADSSDQNAWYLEGLTCMIFEFRQGRVARLRHYYAASPNDRTGHANVPSRFAAAQMAGEHAALRRVATLVAQGARSSAVFNAVTAEAGDVLGASAVALGRYDDDMLVVVASSGTAASYVRVGDRVPLDGVSATETVRRTGRAVRMDNYGHGSGAIDEIVRRGGVQSTVAAPVMVDGRTWGVLAASWTDRGPPAEDAEQRIARFAELLDIAIANADSRDQLTASRARVLAAGDEARRRVVRDLHDGAQQRLVHTIVTLKLAQRALREDPAKAEALVAEGLENAERANAELRELAHGILPSVLSRGLRAGVSALISRLELPVDVDVSTPPLPADVEASAYFIVAEALTNVVKHAHATRARVTANADGGVLVIEVRDDGIGGADPHGPGLIGIADRVEALDGRLRIETQRGTLLAAELPLPSKEGAWAGSASSPMQS